MVRKTARNPTIGPHDPPPQSNPTSVGKDVKYYMLWFTGKIHG